MTSVVFLEGCTDCVYGGVSSGTLEVIEAELPPDELSTSPLLS